MFLTIQKNTATIYQQIYYSAGIRQLWKGGTLIKMEIQALSKEYKVTIIQEKDITAVFELCKNNPQYYSYCPPNVSIEGIKKDLKALPAGKTFEDKYYLGFWDNGILVAVMDLILSYPDDETAFIGFFMVNSDFQQKGIGSGITRDIFICLRERYKYVRLGYVMGNKQSEGFWKKNGFSPTGIVKQTEHYKIITMQKEL